MKLKLYYRCPPLDDRLAACIELRPSSPILLRLGSPDSLRGR